MKLFKRFFCLLCLFLLVNPSVFANEPIVDATIQSIPQVHELDQKLNKLYNGLYFALNNEDKKELKAQQRAWLKKRDADFIDWIHYQQSTQKKNNYLALEGEYYERLTDLAKWIKRVNISGIVHVQDIGDVPLENGKWVEAQEQPLRIEAIKMKVGFQSDFLGIEYRCHLQDIGDTEWMGEGALCGTRGESRRLEGFALRLTGSAAKQFSVKYQCRSADLSDSRIYSDGEFCGTQGEARAVEAVRVWLEQSK